MIDSPGRIIKRYANRKLYDTQDSRYVTLEQIAEMIRVGENVKVVDNNTKDDLTSVTLAQIIFEEEKKQRSFLPLGALRKIIQHGGESLHDLVNQISESAKQVGHVFHTDEKEHAEGEEEQTAAPVEEAQPEAATSGGSEWATPPKFFREFMEGVQKSIDDWQHKVDNNIHQALETVSPLAPLQKEIQVLGERLEELEGKLSQIETPRAE